MLASKYCLKKEKDYARVEAEGRIFHSETFGIAFYDRKDKEVSKFGFIVSNKISKEATLRNRVKRALKAAVRYSFLDLKKGFDVVFLAKQNILRKTTEEIMNETKEALKKADLYL